MRERIGMNKKRLSPSTEKKEVQFNLRWESRRDTLLCTNFSDFECYFYISIIIFSNSMGRFLVICRWVLTMLLIYLKLCSLNVWNNKFIAICFQFKNNKTLRFFFHAHNEFIFFYFQKSKSKIIILQKLRFHFMYMKIKLQNSFFFLLYFPV